MKTGLVTETGLTRGNMLNLMIPVEEQAPCFFLSNYVLAPNRNEATTQRGYFEFLGPLIKGEGPESQLALAFSAVSMASLANRPSSKHRADLRQLAIAQYAKALKATNLALQNPATQKSDQTLAAVLMLGFYEVSHYCLNHRQIPNLCA